MTHCTLIGNSCVSHFDHAVTLKLSDFFLCDPRSRSATTWSLGLISFVSLVSLGHNSRLVSRWPTRPWISCAVRESPLLAVDRVWQGHGILPMKHATSAVLFEVKCLQCVDAPDPTAVLSAAVAQARTSPLIGKG